MTTEVDPVCAPTGPTPADGTANLDMDLSTAVDFSWSDCASGETSSFKFYLGTDPNNPTFRGSRTAPTATFSVSLAYDTTYYWQVVAVGQSGAEAPSAVWSVTTFPYDLSISGAGLSNATLEIGELFTVSVSVSNAGATAPSTTLRYYRSSDEIVSATDIELASDPIPALGGGTSSNQIAQVFMPAEGVFWIGACVDPPAGEAGTSNNCSPGVASPSEPPPPMIPCRSSPSRSPRIIPNR